LPVPAFTFAEQLTACDLCGGTKLEVVAAAANIVRCQSCGYRFVSPRPSQEEIGGSYSEPDFYDQWIADEAGRQRMWAKRLDLVRRVGQGARVLDIGAGIGTFLELGRARFGWDVVGTEVSTSAAKLARERFHIDLQLGIVEDVGLAPASYDLITMWHVLEHVPSPARTLGTCRTLLKPGGLLAVAVPNDSDARAWLVSTKARLARRSPPPRYEPLHPGSEVHLSQFDGRVLVKALSSRGFDIISVTVDDQYANPTPRSEALVSAYRVMQRATRLNFAQAMFVLAQKKRAAPVSSSAPA
jgi:SAM-dependent methyltransferase